MLPQCNTEWYRDCGVWGNKLHFLTTNGNVLICFLVPSVWLQGKSLPKRLIINANADGNPGFGSMQRSLYPVTIERTTNRVAICKVPVGGDNFESAEVFRMKVFEMLESYSLARREKLYVHDVGQEG